MAVCETWARCHSRRSRCPSLPLRPRSRWMRSLVTSRRVRLIDLSSLVSATRTGPADSLLKLMMLLMTATIKIVKPMIRRVQCQSLMQLGGLRVLIHLSSYPMICHARHRGRKQLNRLMRRPPRLSPAVGTIPTAALLQSDSLLPDLVHTSRPTRVAKAMAV